VQEIQEACAAEENCISRFVFASRVFWEITIRSATAPDEMAVELHNFENVSEKVNQFNAISDGFPTIENTINASV
jgi:hypothetical protein